MKIPTTNKTTDTAQLTRLAGLALSQAEPSAPKNLDESTLRGFLPLDDGQQRFVGYELDRCRATTGAGRKLVEAAIEQISYAAQASQRSFESREKELKPIPEYIRGQKEATSLAAADIVEIVAIGACCVALIAVPLVVLPSFLFETITESMTVAVGLSVFGIAGGVLWKGLSGTRHSGEARRKFHTGLAITAIFGWFLWGALFGFAFGDEMVLAGGGDDLSPLAPVWMARTIILLAIMLEPTTAVVGWLSIRRTLDAHRPWIRNRLQRVLARLLKREQATVHHYQTLLAQLHDRKARHDAVERVHSDRAEAEFNLARARQYYLANPGQVPADRQMTLTYPA